MIYLEYMLLGLGAVTVVGKHSCQALRRSQQGYSTASLCRYWNPSFLRVTWIHKAKFLSIGRLLD